jgi:hypothetical protein
MDLSRDEKVLEWNRFTRKFCSDKEIFLSVPKFGHWEDDDERGIL